MARPPTQSSSDLGKEGSVVTVANYHHYSEQINLFIKKIFSYFHIPFIRKPNKILFKYVDLKCYNKLKEQITLTIIAHTVTLY